VSEALFSPSWYRVAALKPRIRSHARILRQSFRDKVWFILQDYAAERSHRFSPAAHYFIGLMDGERTVQEIWEAASAHLGDGAPTQEEAIRLLGQLHAADALLCDVPPDSMEVFRRHQRHQRMLWRRRLWTPMALRFPLFDPDRFLQRTLPTVQPLLGWFGLVLWLAVVGTGAVMAASHWTDLTKDISDRVLDPKNLVLLWFVYPVVKTLHELGHAYATRKWGGEVHEIGIMLLVFSPVPYVDASSAWAFRDKRKRMVVGAAGIAVELFLGALALFTWLAVEPGAVRAVAYNVMLISGVSTLLFNGNPLLRFDGYYVLADAIEIPNLGSRSNQYLGYLFQRYVVGVGDAESPAHSAGERFWMIVYGIASFVYRIFISFIIITFIAGKFFVIGVVLAIWAVATQEHFISGQQSHSAPPAGTRAVNQRPAGAGRNAIVVRRAGAELDPYRGRRLGARGSAGPRRRGGLHREPVGAGRRRGRPRPAVDPGRGALPRNSRRGHQCTGRGIGRQVRCAGARGPGAGRPGARGTGRRAGESAARPRARSGTGLPQPDHWPLRGAECGGPARAFREQGPAGRLRGAAGRTDGARCTDAG
jgi:putative peptide zinc metalloprotease protein